MVDLSQVFSCCLSSDPGTRFQGEQQLQGLQLNPEFPTTLLQYLASPAYNDSLRLFAAVTLKNLVHKQWMPDEGLPLNQNTKGAVKSTVFNAMLSANNLVANQLREVIAIIASHEFPAEWPHLLDQIYGALCLTYINNPHAVVATFKTCHKLFKKYRFSFRSDALWSEIKLVVDTIFDIYLENAKQMFQALQSAQNIQDARAHLGSFESLLKVFLSLNGQDIPQQFEDSLKDWMALFNIMLNVPNPILPADDEELFKVRGKVLKCLTLYAQKYDEDFEPYAEGFCKTVWELLARTSGNSQYDKFVSAALDFFRVVTFKPQIAQLLHSNLPLMFSSLILPNMLISEQEEDTAETSPSEFLKMFLEDANEETRRAASVQLMKALVKQFPESVFQVISSHQSTVLAAYQSNPSENWRQLDALILLLTGIYPTLYTPRNGVTALATSNQHILEIYSTLIAPNMGTTQPILLSSLLKFIYVYRNQFPRDMLMSLLNSVAGLLEHNDVLVASYAGATLERLLMIKEQERVLVMTKEMIVPSLKSLLQYVANAMSRHPKNVYIMKAFFRVIWLAHDSFAPFALPACDVFIEYLKQVMSRPEDADPNFNHLIFECIALSAKNAHQNLPALAQKLEAYMALIIQKSHPELLPYAFQIQSLFIKLSGSLSDTNHSIMTSILPLSNWESGSKYYAPALVIFLISVLETSPAALHGQENALCAIVLKLMQLGLDGQAFSLLTAMIERLNIQSVLPHITNIYILIFTKLHNSRQQQVKLTARFHKGVITFVASFILAHGAQLLSESMNVVQQSIFNMLVKAEVNQNVRSVDTSIERKYVAVALTNLLIANILPQDIWIETCISCVKLMETQLNLTSGTQYSNGLIDLPEENTIQMSRDTFQKIYSVDFPPLDKVPSIGNEKELFLKTLTSLSYPSGSLLQVLAPALDSQTHGVLQTYSSAFGIPLA